MQLGDHVHPESMELVVRPDNVVHLVEGPRSPDTVNLVLVNVLRLVVQSFRGFGNDVYSTTYGLGNQASCTLGSSFKEAVHSSGLCTLHGLCDNTGNT